jgi:hypothetical protein
MPPELVSGVAQMPIRYKKKPTITRIAGFQSYDVAVGDCRAIGKTRMFR